jgi:hypothetical protein
MPSAELIPELFVVFKNGFAKAKPIEDTQQKVKLNVLYSRTKGLGAARSTACSSASIRGAIMQPAADNRRQSTCHRNR